MPRIKHQDKKPFNPEIKRGLKVILLLLAAALLILSYFGLAGTAGNWLDTILAWLFGKNRLIVPALLIIIGILIEIQSAFPYNSRHLLGFLIFVLGVNGLTHLKIPLDQSLTMALEGKAGGFFGLVASYPLLYLFGFWAALIVLGALILAALLLLLNTSLAKLVYSQKILLTKLGTAGKIIFGVISLFVKRPPMVTGYDEELEEKDSFSLNFQRQALKQATAETAAEAIEEKDFLGQESKKLLEQSAYQKTYTRGLPPLSLLSSRRSLPTAGDIKANIYTIQKTLENFGIPVEMGAVQVGPTVTQYTLKPADGIKLSRLTALNNDLSLSLAAHPIRIEAPIPGKSLVGLEVPNQKVAIVSLREVLDTAEFQEKRDDLKIALGKDVAGKPWITSLTHLPHLLVAGATGSGKTVCLNSIIISLLFQHTPEILRFVMVDPKRVELPLYNGIPHLLTPVITDVHKTVNALKWTIGEMERRFELLSKSGRRDIASYNKIMEEKMPYIIFIVDELADLMVAAGAEIEAGVIRLAQMARAVGIHLILATQRPSVDIITGLIKANIPARIAFSVASAIDSRTILDTSGAEKLLGRGDMLWSPPDLSKPKRLQGAYVSDEEIKQIVDFFKKDELPEYNEEITDKQQVSFSLAGPVSSPEDSDPLLEEAKEVIIQAGKASASLLQRRLKVGYARAARLLDLLEAMGFIGPGDGAKPREILTSGTKEFQIIPAPQEKTDEEKAT